jgi:hypothetical protein
MCTFFGLICDLASSLMQLHALHATCREICWVAIHCCCACFVAKLHVLRHHATKLLETSAGLSFSELHCKYHLYCWCHATVCRQIWFKVGAYSTGTAS